MANEMRDRLVELIKQAEGCPPEYDGEPRDEESIFHCGGCKYEESTDCLAERIADHLIENGVIVSPCKVGDVVYFTNEDYHDSAEIDGINITEQGIGFTYVQYEYGPDITEVWDDGEFSIDEIGKTVFLTREAKEQAERKLKEMRGGNGNL